MKSLIGFVTLSACLCSICPFQTYAAEVILFDGKMWQQIDDGAGRSWYEAKDYCEKLQLGGLTSVHPETPVLI
jgi:hypothetical protein